MLGLTSVFRQGLVSCPECLSSELQWSKHSREKGQCKKCGQGFKFDGNVLFWDKTGKTVTPTLLLVFLRRLWSFLNPLSNPLLPFRYLSQIRINRFYQRTLSDTDLARKWAGHYLDGLDLPKEAIVLDFGCGRGRNIGILNQLGYRVFGQDVEFNPWWNRLTACGFQVTQGSSNLPWSNSEFDLIIEYLAIQCIHEDQLLKHAQEIKRILKPDGYWLLLETNSRSFGARQMRLKIGRLHELDKIKELTVNSGFIEISQSFEGFYAPYFPTFINFIRKICAPWEFDMFDYNSWVASIITPKRRAMWLLRLKK